MNAAPSQRFRLAMILVPLMALALGSFWLFDVMRRGSDEMFPSATRTAPDFYVDHFSYVKISKTTGQALYHFAGDKLVHHPRDDSYEITQPVLRNVGKSEDRVPITIRAERGTSNSDNSEIRLYDDVRVDRPATATRADMHMRTEYLLVLPDEDVLKTPQPVHITVGTSTLSGVGMYANNATREFKLTSDVHGTYQAPQP